MKKIGVIVNTEKPRAASVLRTVWECACDIGLNVVVEPEGAALVPEAVCIRDDRELAEVDAVLALGGDGTMLAAVRRLDGLDKPLIGVNIGSLGFMTSVAEQDIAAALKSLKQDECTVSERTLLRCEVWRQGKPLYSTHTGLNDVVVRNVATSRVVRLEVSIDGNLVTTYVCDGIIVSTPTGSTGYSLSAGGPIVLPSSCSFVLSVICPHTLSSRPLVVPDQCEMDVTVSEQASDLLLTIDGQDAHTLHGGDRIRLCKADRVVRFLHLPSHNYFSVLRQKLNWSGSAVTRGHHTELP